MRMGCRANTTVSGKDINSTMARKVDDATTADEEMIPRDGGDTRQDDAEAFAGASATELEQRVREAEEGAMRARAEIQNIKRRQREEIEKIQDTATEHLVKELLPVLDDLERALEASGSTHNFDALRGGVELVLNKLQAALRTAGVERMPGLGAAFDPEYHEAVQQLEPSQEFPSGTIAQELRSGYTQHGHVIRPSLVAVAHE
jgi:molecular chaperone GrpE